MDEPFASLDDEKRAEMRDLLRALLERRETTLVLVTHSRDDALDLARRVLILDRGKPAACDLLETVVARPRHAAAARALGLGQILEAEITAAGEAETAFGNVSVPAAARMGRVRILVRPGQPRVVADPDGIETEVVSMELRPSEAREVRRIAVVRVSGKLLRLFASDDGVCVGRRIRVRITGECELMET
jgi:ABC-type sulfate/molybdate transport systems ATPase subunit